MTILMDADGCPVVDLTLQIAKQFGVPVIILCDTAHQIEREGAQTLVFDKGADSVDFALVNRVKPGDIVVTQDYGLASMCLAKCARVLNQNGLEYTADNIDALMLRRYENKKLLRAGKHPKGSPQRTKEQDVRFADTLEKILRKAKMIDTSVWKAGKIRPSFYKRPLCPFCSLSGIGWTGDVPVKKNGQTNKIHLSILFGGASGSRTLAPVSRPIAFRVFEIVG